MEARYPEKIPGLLTMARAVQYVCMGGFYSASTITVLVAANDALPASKTPANLVCTGRDDDLVLTAALRRMAPTGGHLHLTEGSYALSATVSAEVDNVLISGRGRATRLVLDGSSPCLDAGARSGWVVRDLRTDAGGVDLSSASESAATYWRDGGSYVVEGYPGADVSLPPPGGRKVKNLYVTPDGKLHVAYEEIPE